MRKTGVKNVAPLCITPTTRMYQRWNVDCVGPLNKTASGNRQIITFIDQHTKVLAAYAVPDIKAETLVKILQTQFFPIYGIPEAFHCDNGTNFRSVLMEDVCKRFAIKQSFTTPYHPEANGQIENANKTLGVCLTLMSRKNLKNWDCIHVLVTSH